MLHVCKDRKATLLLLSITTTLAACVHTAPEVSRGGFVPASTGDVVEESANEQATDAPHTSQERSSDGSVKSQATPRFGTTLADGGNIELGLTLTAPFLNIPLTTGAHQFGGTGAYAPLKYDLGGLVLAAALAIGTVFLLPKFLPGSDDFLNNGGYPSHGRSDFEKLNSINQTTSAFSDLINRLDDSLLSNYHIDSTACAYRVICNAVQKAKYGVSNGRPTAVDSLVHVLTRTPIFKGYFPPAWSEIADAAWTTDELNKAGEGCNDVNMQKRCPVNADIAKIVLGNLMPRSGHA